MEETAASFTEKVTQYLSRRYQTPPLPSQIDPQSLSFKTILHAASYYIPQDAALMAAAVIHLDYDHKKLNPAHTWDNRAAALQRFQQVKGLEDSEINIIKRKGLWVVQLKK